MGNNYVEQKSLVPVIHKNQFDAISTEFLTKYCLESLKASMIVPIADVAKKKMGLRIIAKYRLSEYFSIYGKICSTSRITPIYGQEDEYRDLEVRAGTILTDHILYVSETSAVCIIPLRTNVHIGISTTIIICITAVYFTV